MNQAMIARMVLTAQIWAMGKSWGFWFAAALLILAATLSLLLTPNLARQTELLSAAIAKQSPRARAKAEPSATAPAADKALVHVVSPDVAFYGLLSSEDAADERIGQLFRLAAQQDLPLADMTYRYALNADGQFMEMTIETPIKGPYPKIVQFCQSVLSALPNAALDAIDFKREHVGDSDVEAKARFIIYMAPAERSSTRSQP